MVVEKNGGNKQFKRNMNESTDQLKIKLSNQKQIRFIPIPTSMPTMNDEQYKVKIMNRVLAAVGNGNINAGCQIMTPHTVKRLDDDQKLSILNDIKIPTMSIDETAALMSDIKLSRDKLLLLGNYVKHHIESWIFGNARDVHVPSQIYAVPKIFDLYETEPDEFGYTTTINFWWSKTTLKVLAVIQRHLDEGNTIGITLGLGPGIYTCEQGDHGNTSLRFGFTQCSGEGDKQGVFHMTGVVRGKDTYERMKNTIGTPLENERKYMSKCKIMVITNMDTNDLSATYVPKELDADLFVENQHSCLLYNESEEIESINISGLNLGLPFGPYPPSKLFKSIPKSVNNNYSFQYHNINMLATGDYLFIAMMQGKDGMASWWCPYCKLTKAEWQIRPSKEEISSQCWTLDDMKTKLLEYENLKRDNPNTKVKGVLGIKQPPLWSYSPQQTIPAVLHGPMGAGSLAWDGFELFQQQISNVSDEERNARLSIDSALKDVDEYKKEKELLDIRKEEILEMKKERSELLDSLSPDDENYQDTVDDLNSVFYLLEDVNERFTQMEDLYTLTMEDLKSNKDLVEKFNKKQNYAEDLCLQSRKKTLAKHRIYRQAFLSRSFIGPHLKKLMDRSNVIMSEICNNLKQHCHQDVDHAVIDVYCERLQGVLDSLNTISSYSKSQIELT